MEGGREETVPFYPYPSGLLHRRYANHGIGFRHIKIVDLVHLKFCCSVLRMIHLPLFTVKSWSNGMSCMCYCVLNSLAPGGFENIFQNVFFKLISWIDTLSNSCETALRSMPQNPSDDKSTLVQVMAWCRQAASHYLSQCCPRSLSPYGVTRPQWVNATSCFVGMYFDNPEITPAAMGTHRFDGNDQEVRMIAIHYSSVGQCMASDDDFILLSPTLSKGKRGTMELSPFLIHSFVCSFVHPSIRLSRQNFAVTVTQQPLGWFTPNQVLWNCLGL